MAIVEKGQGVNVGETEIPDNDSSALTISSSDNKDYVILDTTNSDERIKFVQEVTVPDGSIGNPSIRFTSVNTGLYTHENGVAIACSGSRKWLIRDTHFGTYDRTNGPIVLHESATATNPVFAFSSDKDTGIARAAADELSLVAGGVECLRLTAGGVGKPFGTQGGGTVGTGGSSDATLEQTSASTFQTALHVGAAIKIVDSGDGEVFLRTVASITDANTLEMDEVAVVENGSAWYHDSGELFAVKTGDSKSLFSVNETGAIGCGSAAGTAHASNNIAIGDDDSLDAITTGVSNVIVGGSNATHQLTTGSQNFFGGYRAGEDATTTNDTVAIGFIAGAVGVIGDRQVLVGVGAGTSSTDDDNVAIGYHAMYDCSGSNNVAIGSNALDNTGDADKCVALGHESLTAATGDQNCGLGFESGKTITDGTGNLCIGYQSNTGASQVKSISIGYQVAASVNQKCYIGDGASATTIVFSGSGNSWTDASDSRIKENVTDTNLGLDFINALRPVKYTEINPQDWPEEIRPHIFFDKTETRINEETGEEETYTVPASERSPTCETVFDGLIAQEVKAAADASGTTFSGFEDNEANGKLGLQYPRFVVPLIKSVQQLTSQIETLRDRIATLEAGD